MPFPRCLLLCLLAMIAMPTALARKWTDQSGKYKIDAELVAFDNDTVVLKKKNGDLIAVKVAQLSKADQAFLKSSETELEKGTGQSRAWTLRNGMKLAGRIVGYDKHPVIIQRRLGRVFVNNQRFDKLPEIYQVIVPKIVEHFTDEKIDGEKGLEKWLRSKHGQPQEFECEGVMMELSDGQLYCVPFFLFDDEVQKELEPGWKRWLAAQEDYQKKEQESFLLHAQTEAYRREQARMQQIQQLQLNLQAYDAGLFDLWEVTMYPPPGAWGLPLSVVVPARNNLQAAEIAQRQNPGYIVGPMRIVPRLR